MGLLVDRYLETHDKPLPEAYPACWEFTAGEFHFAMNGHKEPRIGGPHDGMRGDVPPFSCCIYRKGWLVALVDPGGGGGFGDFEDAIIAALQSQFPAPTL